MIEVSEHFGESYSRIDCICDNCASNVIQYKMFVCETRLAHFYSAIIIVLLGGKSMRKYFTFKKGMLCFP